ncbi:helix-turn-helix domain-containing protein [Cellulomonas humilata]|uniref:Helix-turn-helix domain-containing protein n=1 Tax=Cellulomonas humilata TaxID=144055 RepID=A0A7Y6DY36_9CELL|nr:helix-turn-helix domain-containing protein [Cellulomonas humilata]NUU19176.1 helix-turn-helix domain-containing protein [Cellulomonas humilata]
MSLVLRSDDLPPDDRIEIIHDAIWAGVLPVEIDYDRPGPQIEVLCKVAQAGPVNFSSARSTPTMLRRTPALARQDHDPTVFLAVQVSGTTMVAQGDHQAVLRAGDMVVYESTRPYTVLNTDRTELHYFQVPRSALALADGALAAVTGLRIGPDNNALAAVVAPYFDSLGSTDVLDDPTAAALVAGPSIDLLRALIATHVADPGLAAAPLHGSLVLRVQEYVRAHLADRGLSAATIAAAHHVSVRHLYAELARAGIRLGDWIRTARLEACRRDLRDPASAHLTAATVGARWGFADASHFGRLFRDAFGTTPREWRLAGPAGVA